MYSGILLYTVIWILAGGIVSNQYKRYLKNYHKVEKLIDKEQCVKKKLSILSIIVVAILFTVFNYYVTVTSVAMAADRQNYVLNFQGVRKTPSIGLQLVMNLVHLFNGKIEDVYYLTTFIAVIITLIAYRYSKDASPRDFVLLCLTQYFLTTITALKQCYASALGILALVLIINYDTKKSSVAAWVAIGIACFFHPSAFILIPLYVMTKGSKSKRNLILYFFAMAVGGIFFEPLMLMVSRVLSPLHLSIAEKIFEYFGELSVSQQDEVSLAFLKGFPYYLITTLGLTRRKFLKDKIRNYDLYLIVVGTGAFLYLMSLYSVWLSRFSSYFSLISFVFFSLIMKEEKNRTNYIIYSSLILFSVGIVTYRFLFLVYSMHGGF